MKSDIIAKQFIYMLGRRLNSDLQDYLDGKNEWDTPIMVSDIIQIEYSLSSLHCE